MSQIEGRNPVKEALVAGQTINKIWVQKRKDAARLDLRIKEIIDLAQETSACLMYVDKKVLDQMAESRNHQGVIAQVAAKDYADPFEIIQKVKEEGRLPFVILLDDLQDGYNFGSIIRTAEAAGVDLIVIPKRRSVVLDAHVAKASAGAIAHVPVARVVNLSQFVLQLKKADFWIVGTDLQAKESYTQQDWKMPVALVVGNEGRGIAPKLKEHCDFLVKIPMRGKVNSLNAAVATAVIVFAAQAQREED